MANELIIRQEGDEFEALLNGSVMRRLTLERLLADGPDGARPLCEVPAGRSVRIELPGTLRREVLSTLRPSVRTEAALSAALEDLSDPRQFYGWSLLEDVDRDIARQVVEDLARACAYRIDGAEWSWVPLGPGRRNEKVDHWAAVPASIAEGRLVGKVVAALTTMAGGVYEAEGRTLDGVLLTHLSDDSNGLLVAEIDYGVDGIGRVFELVAALGVEDGFCPACESSSSWELEFYPAPEVSVASLGRAIGAVWIPCDEHSYLPLTVNAAGQDWTWTASGWTAAASSPATNA